MGHLEPSEMASGPRWREVKRLLGEGANVEILADATVEAAESELRFSDRDPALVYTVWLLTQIPIAARQPNYVARLAELGFPAESTQSLHGFVAAFSNAVNAHVGQSVARTDLGELARLAAAESFSTVVGSALPSLFGASPDDFKAELGKLATKSKFARFTRDFFARLTCKTLEYYLSREQPNHVGPGESYTSIDDQIAFRQALDDHCYAASAIVERFAGGWYGKANYHGEITPDQAGKFASYALKKMRNELRRRRGQDG